MAAANALLDTLRVPREVVVDDKIAELEIDTFSGGFGGNHDARFFAEVIDQGCAFVSRGRAGDAIRALYTGPSMRGRWFGFSHPCSIR